MICITRISVYLNTQGKVVYFLLDYEKTKLRLREHYDSYNAQLKISKPDLYGKLSLKSAYLTTAETLIHAFGGFLQNNRLQKLNPERPFIAVLQAISNRKKNHRCTIYRHLEFLQQAGIVVWRKNVGNGQGVEIKLNTKILVARIPLEEIEFNKLRAYQKNFTDVTLKKILKEEICFEANPKGYVAKYSTLEKNIINLNTENFCFPDSIKNENDFSKNIELEGVPEFLKDSVNRVLRAEKNNVSPGPAHEYKVAGDDPSLRANIEMFTQAAWQFAKNTLYTQHNFDHYQTALAQDRIREYFALITHRNYNDRVTLYLQEFIQRILLARNYAAKRPGRYIPVPWKYFDRHFEYGFKGTYPWLEKVKEKQLQNKEYYQGLMKVSYLITQCLKNPERKMEAIKILAQHKNKKLLELFNQNMKTREDFVQTFRKSYHEGFS